MQLLFMFFMHIVDDYYLQGWLASAKQKKYWISLPNYSEKYKYDYMAALIMHAFSWTFMIMLPIVFQLKFNINYIFYIVYIINFVIHAFVDNMKANLLKINLVQDQIIHIIQILITFIIFSII